MKLEIIIILICISIPLVLAASVGTSDLTEGKVVYTPPAIPINYSTIGEVNTTDFWDLLDTPADISIADLGTKDHNLLDGLLDDDHTIYLLTDGSRALTGDWNFGNYEINGTWVNATYGQFENISADWLNANNLNITGNLSADYFFGNFTGGIVIAEQISSTHDMDVFGCLTSENISTQFLTVDNWIMGGELKIDNINISVNTIFSSTGTINFLNDALTTTGLITGGSLIIDTNLLTTDITNNRVGINAIGAEITHELTILKAGTNTLRLGDTTNNVDSYFQSGGAGVGGRFLFIDGRVGGVRWDVANGAQFIGDFVIRQNDDSRNVLILREEGDAEFYRHISQVDNAIHYFGTAGDTEAFYNSTDFIINPRAIGTGDGWLLNDWHITENLDVEGNLTGNQIHGKMSYHNHTATEINFATQYENYTLWMDDADSLNGFSHLTTSGGSSNLTALVSGKYQANIKGIGDGQNNHIYVMSLYVNDVSIDECDAHKKMSAGGDIVTMIGFCFVDLNVGDIIDVRVADWTIGGGTGNYYGGNLNLVRVGDI